MDDLKLMNLSDSERIVLMKACQICFEQGFDLIIKKNKAGVQ